MSRNLKHFFWGLVGIAAGCLLLSIPVYAAEEVAVEAPKATAGERMLEKADQVLASLIDAATRTGEFIGEQAPLVIQELILFHTAIAVAAILFSLGFAWFGYYLHKVGLTKHKERQEAERENRKYYGGDWMVLVIMGPFVPGLVSIIMLSFWVPELLKLTLAPRVWLIEYAANLVR